MTLFRHEMKRAWKALLIWTLAIGFFLAIAIFVYPEMKNQMDQLSEAFASMGSFSSAFGMDIMDYGSLTGFYGVEIESTLGLGGALFAALIGIGMLANEEKRGTAEFLLTHPVRRSEVVTAKLLAMLAQITILSVTVFLMTVGSIAAIGEAVPWKEAVLLHTAYFLMMVELGCICFGISASLWKGGMGIGLGLAIAAYILNIIANLSDKVEFLKFITPFGYANGSVIVSDGRLDGMKILVGMGIAAAAAAYAYVKYSKKDIR